MECSNNLTTTHEPDSRNSGARISDSWFELDEVGVYTYINDSTNFFIFCMCSDFGAARRILTCRTGQIPGIAITEFCLPPSSQALYCDVNFKLEDNKLVLY